MRTDGFLYRFGPFELDSSRRVLNRGVQTVFLPDRYLDVLLLLVSHNNLRQFLRSVSCQVVKFAVNCRGPLRIPDFICGR